MHETELRQLLQAAGIRRTVMCGLALDVCVGASALHSAELGFETLFVHDACRGVTSEGIASMQQQLAAAGARWIDAATVESFVA